MTVGELKAILDDYVDDELEVVFKPSNSRYAEDFTDYSDIVAVRSFYGSDFEAVVLYSGGQVGGV